MMINQFSCVGFITKLTLLILIIFQFSIINSAVVAQGNCGPNQTYNWVTGGCDINTPYQDPQNCGSGKTRSVMAGGCVTDNSEQVKEDIKNLETMKQMCESYPGSSACDRYDAALRAYQYTPAGQAKQKAIENRKKCVEKYGEPYCQCKYDIKGVYLNTQVPFVGTGSTKRCLATGNSDTATVNVLQAMTRILMTFVMVGGFGMIIWGGVQIASGDVKAGREKIIGVVIAFALLGSLGVILRFINPNFFS